MSHVQKTRSGLVLSARLEIQESLRSRWFHVYAAVFVGLILLLAVTGVAESRVLGFMGLSRLLVTFIQITMAILPLFVLVTTARSLVGDREAGNLEYLLAFPISLSGWYWGKFLGRLVLTVIPLVCAFIVAVIYGAIRGFGIPWTDLALYVGLTAALSVCFLGMGFLLSSLARSTEVALGVTLFIWLLLVALLDLVLLSVLIKSNVDPDVVIGIAIANPLQAFRTAAMILFDPQLILLGPSAYLILDAFGAAGFVAWAMIYPAVLGLICAAVGYWRFSRGDLV